MNRVFLFTDFDQQETRIAELLLATEKEKSYIDRHNLLVIYYKAGVFYFAQQNYVKSKEYFQLLIQDKDNLRTDLKGFARLLMVLIDYDSGQEEYIDRRVKAAYLYFQQNQSINTFQEIFLSFIGDTGNIYPQELKKRFIALKLKLEQLKDETFTKKLQLYFDLMAWLTAKIENKTFKEVVQEQAKMIN